MKYNFSDELMQKTEDLLSYCKQKNIKIITAESCTGGLVAALLTDISGSSSVVECGYVTYSNHAKITLLGVLADTLENHGAVSAEVAAQMARGALLSHELETSDTNPYVSVAVTGIAGPSGGTNEKPVGTVWISGAKMIDGGISCHTEHHLFEGNRNSIRTQTLIAAIDVIMMKAQQI